MGTQDEIKYLNGLMKEIEFPEDFLNIPYSEDKKIVGIISGCGSESKFSKEMQFATIYDSIVNVQTKINYSIEKALEYAYSDPSIETLSVTTVSKEEWLAHYFLENAIFRIDTLWDLLAQLYRLKYNTSKSKHLYYDKLFNPNSPKSSGFKEVATEIREYFNEEDDVSGNEAWKGNHEYLKQYRNKMTHENSPSIFAASDFDFNFADPPTFTLKRAIEENCKVAGFIKDIIASIKDDPSYIWNLQIE